MDTEFPQASVTDARVSGTAEPRVEISWTARDANFDSTPILLEYALSPTALDAEWKPVHAARLPNTGKYTWFVTDPKVWQFYLRVRAIDLAGNETKTPYGKKVIVDLDTPKATIEKIAGNGPPSKAQERGTPAVVNTDNKEVPSLFPLGKTAPDPVTATPVAPAPVTPQVTPVPVTPPPVAPVVPVVETEEESDHREVAHEHVARARVVVGRQAGQQAPVAQHQDKWEGQAKPADGLAQGHVRDDQRVHVRAPGFAAALDSSAEPVLSSAPS